MAQRDAKLKELYLNKPECVIQLPQWLLPPPLVDKFRALSRLALVEIAGRDSVAAAVKAAEEESFTDLLPTYVYTGTEHGNWEAVEQAVSRLARRLAGVRVHQLIVLGSPGFWQALNGRFVGELISRYGFYTPCVGCHLYLHSVRIPLALHLRAPIIAGERELHNGRVKVNQTPQTLDAYQNLAAEFGVRLILPLRHQESGEEVSRLLGFSWPEDQQQLGCVLSGNYRSLEGGVIPSPQKVLEFLEGFALPCARNIVSFYVKGAVPPHQQVAFRILKSLKNSP